MKTLTLLLSLVFALVATLVCAGVDAKSTGEKAAPAAGKAPSQSPAKGKSHEVEAAVVSVDLEKKTITVKTDKGEMTTPVGASAQAGLKDVKPGQKVVLTCQDDAAGAHKLVVAIKLHAAAEPVEKRMPDNSLKARRPRRSGGDS